MRAFGVGKGGDCSVYASTGRSRGAYDKHSFCSRTVRYTAIPFDN